MYDSKRAISSRPSKHEKYGVQKNPSVTLGSPRYSSTDQLAMNGVTVGGTKYMFLSANDRVVRARKGQSGVHCIKTVQGTSSSTSLKVGIYRVQKLGGAQGSGSHAAETCPFARGSSPLITSRRCT